ncbi:uncharacterized protein [Misgurnus anguillicaudatus]|uniref:uncharacterized protein n=1 Tax=Misgurnus anguillicaudatus TaxID=75329 RepID=UPI003CCF264D
MVETLNELAHLKDSGFGRPWPRHGLKLLHWFANECISFENNNEIYSKCDPAQGDYGFHHYQNRSNRRGKKLLPEVNIPYYVVGNLNLRGANQLPTYVSEDNSTHNDDSNTDRIIISLHNNDWIKIVYVTQHNDQSEYDPDATYRISKGLLMIISRMDLDEFLCETGYYHQAQFQSLVQPISPISSSDFRPDTTNVPVVSPAILPPVIEDVSVDMEAPPAAPTIDTKIQIDEVINTPELELSENVPQKKGWCRCTIL